jgi:hypothetical protein
MLGSFQYIILSNRYNLTTEFLSDFCTASISNLKKVYFSLICARSLSGLETNRLGCLLQTMQTKLEKKEKLNKIIIE